METFTQEHVIGIPLTSFAYADEERQGKSSCSAMVHKKSKNLATCFPSASFEREEKLCQYLLDILSMIQIRRVPSFIG
jgi:hypothetical protein